MRPDGQPVNPQLPTSPGEIPLPKSPGGRSKITRKTGRPGSDEEDVGPDGAKGGSGGDPKRLANQRMLVMRNIERDMRGLASKEDALVLKIEELRVQIEELIAKRDDMDVRVRLLICLRKETIWMPG